MFILLLRLLVLLLCIDVITSTRLIRVLSCVCSNNSRAITTTYFNSYECPVQMGGATPSAFKTKETSNIQKGKKTLL